MKLIVEDDNELCAAHVVELNESERKDGNFHPLRVKGIFAVSEKVNKNKRYYPYEMLKREFDRVINEDVKRGSLFGSFEHPDKVIKSDAEEHENAAIFINSIELDEKNKQWIGEATIMGGGDGVPSTPKGSLLYAMYFYSGNKQLCGFSTRGFGELGPKDKDGVSRLLEYSLSTIDIVTNPSVGIQADGILESKEFMRDKHGQIVECAMNDYERAINASARTFDLDKKRDIYKAAWETLLKKI